MATSTIQISQLTLATPVAADSVAGANAGGQARRYTVGSLGTAHTHAFSTVPGLQTALDGKASVASTNLLRVETLNGLNGAVTIAAGSGVTVATQGSKITISASGGGGGGGDVSSVNGQTGVVVLTNTSLSAAASTHTHDASDVTSGTFDIARLPTHTHSIAQVSGLQVELDGKASSTHASQHRTGGSDVVLPVVASATITASANNYSPPTGDIIRLTSTATGTAVITGLSGGFSGAVRVLANVGTNAIQLAHANTNSGSTNRFVISGGADLTLDGGAQASAWYDATSDVWRVSVPAATAAGGGIVSVNGITATAITLTSASVSAASAVHTHTTSEVTGLDERIVDQATNATVVRSLNGLTGVVVITHTSVSAAATSHTHAASQIFLDLWSGGPSPLDERSQQFLGDIDEEGLAYAVGESGGISPEDVIGIDTRIATQATNAAVVRTLGGLTGTITLTGVNLTVATAAGEITLTAGGGGGIVEINGQTATAVTLSAASVTAASTSHMETHRAGGSDEYLPLVTAVSITASVNDYSLPTGDVFRISHNTTNTVNITGLATAAEGSSRLLVNVSTGSSSSYTLKHADTNSTAVSRFLVPWAGDYVISPNGGAALVLYDSTDQRWRVV
jgi:hypothetical protein